MLFQYFYNLSSLLKTHRLLAIINKNKNGGHMCTFLRLRGEDLLFGRNMDIEYSFGEKFVVVPRNYPWKFRKASNLDKNYAIMGVATVINNFPLIAEAVNEKGLVMANLNFPSNAHYFEYKENCLNLTPFELIPYTLKHFESVKEAKEHLKNLNLLNEPFAPSLPLAPLHFILADEYDSIVIESQEDGLHIYDNDLAILSNNPPFPHHIANLENYRNLSVSNPKTNLLNKNGLSYGQGLGAVGLPGDSSPMSRFVQTAFYVACSQTLEKNQIHEAQLMLILEKISMLRGCVKTDEEKWDITSYSACINASKLVYIIKTYDELNVFKVNMLNEDLNAAELVCYDFAKNIEIKSLN